MNGNDSDYILKLKQQQKKDFIVEAKPFQYEFSIQNTALIVIDMQRDFLEQGGYGESLGNDVGVLQKIVPVIKGLLQKWRNLDGLIIYTRENHKDDLSDCPDSKRNRGNPIKRIGDDGNLGRILIRGQPGNDIIQELIPNQNDIIIDKPGKGSFYNTQLDYILRQRGIKNLIVTGVTTEVCVQSTLREANDRGYDCILVEDATESYFQEFKQSTIQMIIAQKGIVGWSCLCQNIYDAIG